MTDIEEIIQKIEGAIGKDKASEQEIWCRVKCLCEKGLQQFVPDSPVKNLTQLITELQPLTEKKDTENMLTGFTDLDKLTGGFSKGEFIVIGGRPAMGKTQFLINLSLNLSKTDPVLYLTFDLSEKILSYRILATLSEINAHKISEFQLTEQERKLVNNAANKVRDYQLSVSETPHKSVDMLITYCIKQIKEHNLKVIVLDYLQLLDYNRYRRYNRDAEVDEICRKLKDLAKEYQVCIIAASQLNRSVEYRTHMGGDDRRPQLSDLRESGSIEQYADKVFFLYRPEYYKITVDEYGNDLTDVIEIIVAKNSQGPTGEILLRKKADFSTIENYDSDITSAFTGRLKELGMEDSFNKLVDTFGLKSDAPF
jgi:replicative DNA helicase